MRLIANKPCSFGGQQFYVGDEIPENLVVDAKMQEKLGVVTIANDMEGVSGKESGTLFTQEQVDKIVADAVDEAVSNAVLEMEQKQREMQGEGFSPEDTVIIPVKGEAGGENGQQTMVMATLEEIQQAFFIMQMNAADGAEAIADVKSENVLILLHAADTRKMIKGAAKKQADNLFSTSGNSNESVGGNATTDTNAEGNT